MTGAWAAGCQSAESGRGYARYYSFTTTEARDVTITLDGSVDPYLYLRSGDRTGSVEAKNDDHGTLVGATVNTPLPAPRRRAWTTPTPASPSPVWPPEPIPSKPPPTPPLPPEPLP